MRNSITILFLFFIISSNAQVWIDQNAKWHYEFWNIASIGYYDIKNTQDTILGGQLCRQIEQTQYILPSGATPADTLSLATEYTYVNSDTVFYWKDNQFFTLFNFGANIGDQWLIGINDPSMGQFACNDSSFVEVTNTSSITINSMNYRTITLTTVNNSSLGLEGTFVERFGFMDTNIPSLPFPRFMNCDSTIVFEWNYVTFKCFEDHSFPIYNPSGEDCVSFTGIQDQIPPSAQLQLSPNPTTGFINVFSDETGTLMLIDYTGKKIKSYSISQSKLIDLSSFARGFYIISFHSKSGSVAMKRVLKI